MGNNEILENIKKIIKEENIKQNEPMKNHTSFKIGGPADFFIKITSKEELKSILELTHKKKIPFTIIGNGSNLLVSDKGIEGIVAKIESEELTIKEIEENQIEIEVDAGAPMGFFAQKLLKNEITGFEELSGIPGTIGGAVVMNAGAHGKEMKDIVQEVTAIDYEGNIYKFKNEECEFEYRHSKFSKGEYIIIQAKIILKKGQKQSIKAKMNQYMQYRREKQPIEYSNAGSSFKRGNNFITAALIDEAGLKGYAIGGAQVSEKHAGFIINKGSATAQDVLDLSNYIKKKIYEKFNKNIELEIVQMGRF